MLIIYDANGTISLPSFFPSHLIQDMVTIDGNFQCNKQTKNGRDQDDPSLYDGHGQFPEDGKFQKYLTGVPPNEEVGILLSLA